MKYRWRAAILFGILAMAGSFLTLLSCSSTQVSPGGKDESSSPQFNQAVLEAIKIMPKEGGYETSPRVDRLLARAFVQALLHLESSRNLVLSPQTWMTLCAQEEKDGVGVWGRWNANGPGTAKLVHDLQLGINFTDYQKALPGDFLKIFWNQHLGKKERGHSVVFLGSFLEQGEVMIRFWSSNLPRGYGEKSVPLRKCRRMIFTRITQAKNIGKVDKLPVMDRWLGELLRKETSWQVVRDQCAIK